MRQHWADTHSIERIYFLFVFTLLFAFSLYVYCLFLCLPFHFPFACYQFCGEINFIMMQPLMFHLWLTYTVFQKSDTNIQITITTAHLIRIKCALSGFNYHLSDVNVANFNKIYRTVSEQQLF